MPPKTISGLTPSPPPKPPKLFPLVDELALLVAFGDPPPPPPLPPPPPELRKEPYSSIGSHFPNHENDGDGRDRRQCRQE